MAILISPCKQLLTLAGGSTPRKGSAQTQLGIIRDGAVWIEKDIVQAVGTAEELERRYGHLSCERIDAARFVVMPGFVDSHAHPIFVHPRLNDYEMRLAGLNYEEIARAGGGILSSVRAVRQCPQRELLRISEVRIRKALEYGTTTMEAKSGYGLDLENELKMLQVIRELNQKLPIELVPTFLGAHEVPPEYRARRAEYVTLITQTMIPRVAEDRLAEFCDCFVEAGFFSLGETEVICKAAQRHGLGIKLHADQITRCGATELGIRVGAGSVDHLEQIESQEIQALSASETLATLLPGSVFHLGLSQYPPARDLIDHGVPVALATDFNPGSSPTINMQTILSIACTQMNMNPAEAIVAATINGAHALRRGSWIGSLEPGKQADICMMDVEDYREIPYFFGLNHCTLTIKKGQVVYTRSSSDATAG
jgi:imidazolonepropionase